jgi:transcriptional antiterminator RfaH
MRSQRNGLIELPNPPGLARGDRVRITSGAFTDHLAIYQGQTAHDRVAVLLQLLGGRQRTELPAAAVEAVR